jgi:hypothetical protein
MLIIYCRNKCRTSAHFNLARSRARQKQMDAEAKRSNPALITQWLDRLPGCPPQELVVQLIRRREVAGRAERRDERGRREFESICNR